MPKTVTINALVKRMNRKLAPDIQRISRASLRERHSGVGPFNLLSSNTLVDCFCADGLADFARSIGAMAHDEVLAGVTLRDTTLRA